MLPLCLCLALLAFAQDTLAETLRVATWSFPASTGASADTEPLVDEAALLLKKLNPDVILLENVRDWQTCSALAQALKPDDYKVLVCSAFRAGATATNAPPQVAILSKHKGYFSWSEPWRVESEPEVSGGVAFAAIRFAKHRVGFFAAHLDPQVTGPNASPAVQATLSLQWAHTLDSFKSWVDNRLEAVVVAGGEVTSDSAEEATALRFLSAPLPEAVVLPAHPKSAKASGGLASVGLTASAASVPAVVLLGPQAACALNLDAPKAPVVPAAPPKTLAAPTPPQPAVAPTNSNATAAPLRPRLTSRQTYLFLGAAATALFLFVGFWVRRRRARSAAATALLPGQGVSSYTLVLSEQSLASPVAPAGVQSPVPQRVPPQAVPESATSPVEAWPPGPVLLPPEGPRAAAQDRAALRFHLAQWLKQKLVQKLLSDRSELLQAQQMATGKLLSLEERLARIERQLQQQNQAYEQRILELNRDLAAAKEENREHIRARIAQVKAEREAARAQLMAQAGAGER